MYVIKMNNNKSLVTTIRATIHQYERNADTLVFLLPMTYEELDISSCKILINYIPPNDVQKFETLIVDEEPYKNHYRCRLKVNTFLTSIAGEIKIWLTFLNSDKDCVLKSDELSLYISPAPEEYGEENNYEDDSIIEFGSGSSSNTDNTVEDEADEIIEF